MELDTAALLATVERSAKAAGNMLNSHKATVIQSRGKDIKISADKEAHEQILHNLKQTDIPILSEEDNIHDFKTELRWVVDPLDGSINFLRSIPFCAVSIGLLHKDEPILGVIHDFNRQETFTGIVGKGAWMNEEPISVSGVQDAAEAVLATGFPTYTDYSEAALKEYISMVRSFKKVRLLGAASLSLAYVACGRLDAYFERDIKVWDVAAGLALVKAAGGRTSDLVLGSDGGCTVSAGTTIDKN